MRHSAQFICIAIWLQNNSSSIHEKDSTEDFILLTKKWLKLTVLSKFNFANVSFIFTAFSQQMCIA